jgi:hypothetical protein
MHHHCDVAFTHALIRKPLTDYFKFQRKTRKDGSIVYVKSIVFHGQSVSSFEMSYCFFDVPERLRTNVAPKPRTSIRECNLCAIPHHCYASKKNASCHFFSPAALLRSLLSCIPSHSFTNPIMNTATEEETMLASFTREEATLLRVAAAFVTIHHRRHNKRPRSSEELLPSRPTPMPSREQHIQHMMLLCQSTPVGTPRWHSLVHHLAQQLPVTENWQPSFEQEALWHALLPLNPAYFASKLIPVLQPQKHFLLLQAALLQAPLSVVETTVDEWLKAPPLLDLAAYYVQTSNGTELLSKWAQDQLLQQLLQRLQCENK